MKVVWAVRKISGNHNHELGGNLAGHAVKRRLSELEKAKVRALGGQGLAPKDILCILHKEFAIATQRPGRSTTSLLLLKRKN
jgi:hypothetical protein